MFVSPAGPDGETGQPSLWRWLRESEEPVSQTAAVSGDGETDHITTNRIWGLLLVLLKTSQICKKKCVYR